MKPGTKLKRINQSSASCKMFVDQTYTVMSFKDGWVQLVEKKSDGHSWHPKNFEILVSK